MREVGADPLGDRAERVSIADHRPQRRHLRRGGERPCGQRRVRRADRPDAAPAVPARRPPARWRSSIELLGNCLAIAIQNMQLQERASDAPGEPPAAATPDGAAGPVCSEPVKRAGRDVVYWAADE